MEAGNWKEGGCWKQADWQQQPEQPAEEEKAGNYEAQTLICKARQCPGPCVPGLSAPNTHLRGRPGS